MFYLLCPSRCLVNRLHTCGTSPRAPSFQGQGVSATSLQYCIYPNLIFSRLAMVRVTRYPPEGYLSRESVDQLNKILEILGTSMAKNKQAR